MEIDQPMNENTEGNSKDAVPMQISETQNASSLEKRMRMTWSTNQWGNVPPPVGGHSATMWQFNSRSPPLIILFGGNADLSQARRPSFVSKVSYMEDFLTYRRISEMKGSKKMFFFNHCIF